MCWHKTDLSLEFGSLFMFELIICQSYVTKRYTTKEKGQVLDKKRPLKSKENF